MPMSMNPDVEGMMMMDDGGDEGMADDGSENNGMGDMGGGMGDDGMEDMGGDMGDTGDMGSEGMGEVDGMGGNDMGESDNMNGDGGENMGNDGMEDNGENMGGSEMEGGGMGENMDEDGVGDNMGGDDMGENMGGDEMGENMGGEGTGELDESDGENVDDEYVEEVDDGEIDGGGRFTNQFRDTFPTEDDFSGADGSTRRDESNSRFKRNAQSNTRPSNSQLNDLARRVLISIEAALVVNQDGGVCLRKVLCENNKYSRSLNDKNKYWIPVWRFVLLNKILYFFTIF